MRKFIKTILLSLLLPLVVQAQYLETGIFLGAANYFGDLQAGKMESSEYNPALGAFVQYNFSKRFSVAGQFVQMRVSGADENATLIADQRRNLSFRSDIYELGIIGKLNLVSFNIPAGQKASPYLFGGVAGFYFNPQAQFQGDWYALQPIGTEGQGDPGGGEKYSLLSLSIPFGVGFKFAVNDRLNIGIELGLRKTFTDYLDDVSGLYPDLDRLRETDPLAASLSFRQPEGLENIAMNPGGTPRGDASTTDWYFIGGITISINLADHYGLDFDPKYEIFKEEILEPEKAKEAPEIF